MNDSLHTPIVIDNGSGWIKAGLAGEDEPKVIFPTTVGADDTSGKLFVGNDIHDRSETNLVRSNPIKHGTITDWSAMEEVWRYTFHHRLQVAPQEHPVLLSDSPLNTKANREMMIQTMFETFACPSVYIANQAVLSLYASGRTTGIVLDCGHDVTHIVPVFRGYPIPQAMLRLNFAGSKLTDHLSQLLTERDLSLETEVVRHIKEKLGYVALDFEKEMETNTERYFQLPNGKGVTIGNERFRCAEALFQPQLIGLETAGIHQSLSDSIMKSDIDVRKDLYSNVVLSGGSTMFGMMRERLERELRALAPAGVKIRVVAPQHRQLSAWMGGSNLAAMSSCKELWINIDEYREVGPSIVHRTCS